MWAEVNFIFFQNASQSRASNAFSLSRTRARPTTSAQMPTLSTVRYGARLRWMKMVRSLGTHGRIARKDVQEPVSNISTAPSYQRRHGIPIADFECNEGFLFNVNGNCVNGTDAPALLRFLQTK